MSSLISKGIYLAVSNSETDFNLYGGKMNDFYEYVLEMKLIKLEYLSELWDNSEYEL